jgi:hypothetical protein
LDPSTGLYADTAYTIVVKTDVSSQITVVDPADLTYSGQAKAHSAQATGVTGFSYRYVSKDGTSYPESSTAPTNAGQYIVTATVTDVDKVGSASKDFTIAKAAQTITGFAATGSRTFGDADYTLSVNQGASTSALTFTSSVPGVATINPTTGLVHIMGAGTTTLTVNQAADGNYSAASAVTQTLTVGKAAQTITGLAATGSKTYGDADYTLSVNQGAATSALTFTSSDMAVATINPTTGLVHIMGAGTTTLTVNQAADGNYSAASAVTQILTVGKADQTITGLAATDSKTYGGIYMDFDLTVTKGASTSALSYSSSNTGVATIHPTTGSVHIVGAGTTTLTLNQAADANYNAAAAVTQILTVGKATPTISAAPTASAITFGQTLADSNLTGGTAITPGSFAFTTPSTAPSVGTANQGVTFTPSDTANYNTATTSVSVTVIDGDLPVPGADAFAAKLAAGMTTKVTLASLLANDRPSANLADARTVTLVSASSTSTGGGSIRIKSGWLIYQPSSLAVSGSTDTFTYTVSNGVKTATGTVTVSLASPGAVQVAIDRVDGNKVYFSVMPGMTFEVQGTSDLTAPVTWSTILNGSSNWTSGADGRLIVTDPAAGASRFYRLKWIP